MSDEQFEQLMEAINHLTNALQANFIVNRRLWDINMAILEATNPEYADKIEDLHEAQKAGMPDVLL